MKPGSLSSGILCCLFFAIACHTPSTTDAYAAATEEDYYKQKAREVLIAGKKN